MPVSVTDPTTTKSPLQIPFLKGQGKRERVGGGGGVDGVSNHRQICLKRQTDHASFQFANFASLAMAYLTRYGTYNTTPGQNSRRRDTEGERDRDTERQTGRAETKRERDRKRQRQRKTETHREGETDTHRETQKETETERGTQRDRDTETSRYIDTERERHTETERDRDTETETQRHGHRDRERQKQRESKSSLASLINARAEKQAVDVGKPFFNGPQVPEKPFREAATSVPANPLLGQHRGDSLRPRGDFCQTNL